MSDQFGATGARLRRQSTSVTVSYVREDGLHATTVGAGRDFPARVADADSQLPAGEWTRVCVSTPASIYGDLQGRNVLAAHDEAWHGAVYQKLEGKRVTR